jgi:hypothetical protein
MRARISIGWESARASFSSGHGSSASFSQSERGRFINEAHIVSARSPIRAQFPGCSLRKGSNSLRVCCQLSCAAVWPLATSCAQPNKSPGGHSNSRMPAQVLASTCCSRGMTSAGRRSRFTENSVCPRRLGGCCQRSSVNNPENFPKSLLIVGLGQNLELNQDGIRLVIRTLGLQFP